MIPACINNELFITKRYQSYQYSSTQFGLYHLFLFSFNIYVPERQMLIYAENLRKGMKLYIVFLQKTEQAVYSQPYQFLLANSLFLFSNS